MKEVTLSRNSILTQIAVFNASIEEKVRARNKAYATVRQIMMDNRQELIDTYLVLPDNSIKITDPRWSKLSQEEKKLRLYGKNAWSVIYNVLHHILNGTLALWEERIVVCR